MRKMLIAVMMAFPFVSWFLADVKIDRTIESLQSILGDAASIRKVGMNKIILATQERPPTESTQKKA